MGPHRAHGPMRPMGPMGPMGPNLTKIQNSGKLAKNCSRNLFFYTEMCRISVRTTLVFGTKVDIPDL